MIQGKIVNNHILNCVIRMSQLNFFIVLVTMACKCAKGNLKNKPIIVK